MYFRQLSFSFFRYTSDSSAGSFFSTNLRRRGVIFYYPAVRQAAARPKPSTTTLRSWSACFLLPLRMPTRCGKDSRLERLLAGRRHLIWTSCGISSAFQTLVVDEHQDHGGVPPRRLGQQREHVGVGQQHMRACDAAKLVLSGQIIRRTRQMRDSVVPQVKALCSTKISDLESSRPRPSEGT